MKKIFFYLLISLVFLSCNKDEPWEPALPNLCEDEYFYYSGGSKISLKHSLNETWIDYNNEDIKRSEAILLLKKYDFIDIDTCSFCSYNRLRIKLENINSCQEYKNCLKQLNTDDEIYSASPVFYRSEKDPESYWIMHNVVTTRFNEEVISEPNFIAYAESLNLELYKTHYSSHQFKIKNVSTGIEALEIANQIYESGYVEFSQPNFIAKIVKN